MLRRRLSVSSSVSSSSVLSRSQPFASSSSLPFLISSTSSAASFGVPPEYTGPSAQYQKQAAAQAASLNDDTTQQKSTHQPSTSSAPPDAPPIRPNGPMSENEKWWPTDNRWGMSLLRRQTFDSTMQSYEGMIVPELTQVPDPANPEQISAKQDSKFTVPEMMGLTDTLEEEKRLLPPATFDPAIDDIEESDWADQTTVKEIMNAAEKDRERLEQFGNPMLAEDQVDYLMQPHRNTQEGMQQRQEFNGFLHWGLLKAADIALDQEADTKKAHSFVNRYLRDIDLFQQWLRHPKVVQHMQNKYRMDPGEKFDKLMAISMALYVRSKIQVMEGDMGGALKSLVSASGLLHEGGGAKLHLPRYKRALGGILMSRSAVYLKLGSPDRAEDDATRALAIVPKERCASLYQIRAEAREQLGKLAEAREDEEIAADIWENAETLHPGMDGPPIKYVH